MLTFGIILLILFGFLMLKVKITIDYSDEVVIIIRVLGISIRIPPKKKKRVKPMTAKQAAKIREKRRKAEEQKRQRAIHKAKKKKAKKEAARQKKEAERKDPEARRLAKEKKRQKKERAATLGENLDLVGKAVGFFFSSLFGHLRIDVARLHITVGSPEAAKTAMLYGVAVQGVSYILAFLDKVSNLKGMKRADVRVDADFLSEEIKVDVKISFSIRVWHLFHLIFGALKRVIANRLAVSKRVKAEHPKTSTTPPNGHLVGGKKKKRKKKRSASPSAAAKPKTLPEQSSKSQST